MPTIMLPTLNNQEGIHLVIVQKNEKIGPFPPLA